MRTDTETHIEAGRAPAVAVVVPLYNKEPYILRCLTSIQRQTFGDFEAVIVDDGSADRGPELARRFGDRRFRVVSQANAGVSAARNRGIRESTAPVIAFLDADDEWAPEFLETIHRLAAAYPDSGILATGYRRILRDQDVAEEVTYAPDAPARITDYLACSRHVSLVTASSCGVRRNALETVGLFAEGEAFGEDRDLWIRISLRYPVAYDPAILATYHCEAAARSADLWRVAANPYPPAVQTLRRYIAEGRLPASTIRTVRRHMDAILMQYACGFIGSDPDGGRARGFLASERFSTVPYRVYAGLLRMCLAVLPFRIARAVSLRARRCWGMLGAARTIFGRRRARAVKRYIPAPRLGAMESGPVRQVE